MSTSVELRPARAGEAASLSALALRSKAHWGYSAEFLDAVREELTVTEEQLGDVTVAEADGRVLGFALLRVEGERAELDHLWVDEPWIGHGVGRTLLRAALADARARGARLVGLDADPGAEPFYAHHGAVTVERVPSGSIPGRTLPRMVIQV